MKNISYWQQTTKLPRYPKITNNSEYDLVIVGGGISGISLAYRLNNSNLKVALLESDTLGSKTTGHTTGKVTYLHGAIVGDIAETYDYITARLYLDSNIEAYQEIKKIIEDKQIDCDFNENIAYIGANDPTNVKKITDQIRLFKSWGFKVIENGLKDCQVSMGLEHQATFHVLKYLKGLLKYCHNIDIYEHSLVTKCNKIDNYLALEVNGITVKTKQIVWMTRYPPNLQKGYFFRIIQEKEHIVYLESESNNDSILDLTTNFSKRKVDDQHILIIKRIDQDKNYWYGQDGKTLRKIPYIGKINDFEYIAYGFNKWGMTLSHVASKLIFDLIIQGDSNYASLYAPNYGKYLKSSKDMMKLVKNNLHGMIKNRLITSNDDHLQRNEGKVIRYHGKLIALYKDKDGRVFHFSPYCPHLKCVVEFNQHDQTWQCPCHGSIFDCYGKIVSGPATSNLKHK